jgi:hypothetical protein
MVERDRPDLPVARQCQLLSISRSSFYAPPQGESDINLSIMAEIDRQFLDTPFYGVRQMTWHLRATGWQINVKRVRRLMRKMGLMPIYQRPGPAFRHIQLDLETCLSRAHAARLIVGIAGTASLLVSGLRGRTGHKHEPMARQSGASKWLYIDHAPVDARSASDAMCFSAPAASARVNCRAGNDLAKGADCPQ